MNGNFFVFRPPGNPGERLQRLAVGVRRLARRARRALPDPGRKLAHPHDRRPDHDREPRGRADVRYGRQVGLFFLHNCLFGMPTPGRSEASPLIRHSARNQLTLNLLGQNQTGRG
jgi:hypothetical protein